MTKPLDMLAEVAASLGKMAAEVVFIGGASLELYSENAAEEPPRITDDVDCIITAATLRQFHAFEERLRQAGFEPCREPGAPLCRWLVGKHKVDFMPLDPQALGFGSRWFRAGYDAAIEHGLPNGARVKILSPAYFLAVKMEAYSSRGGNDPRLSQDLEDVVTVLDLRRDLEKLEREMPAEVSNYLAGAFGKLLASTGFDEVLSAALESRHPAPTRTARVKAFMEKLAKKG